MKNVVIVVLAYIILMYLLNLKGHIRPWPCFRTTYVGVGRITINHIKIYENIYFGTESQNTHKKTPIRHN